MLMPDEFLKKNMEMWERFTSTYMDTMFKAVEKTMEQSKAFKDRVDRAVADAISGQLDATLTALRAMQTQIEALSEKMDRLMEKEEVD
ncbi:MAG: hypothetical protein ACOYZ7_05340 [Chloroflexota bacterium]